MIFLLTLKVFLAVSPYKELHEIQLISREYGQLIDLMCDSIYTLSTITFPFVCMPQSSILPNYNLQVISREHQIQLYQLQSQNVNEIQRISSNGNIRNTEVANLKERLSRLIHQVRVIEKRQRIVWLLTGYFWSAKVLIFDLRGRSSSENV